MLFSAKVCGWGIVLSALVCGNVLEAKASYTLGSQGKKGMQTTINDTIRLRNASLSEVLNKMDDLIQKTLGHIKQEEIREITDPKVVLLSCLDALGKSVAVWLNAYKGKVNADKVACLYLSPSSYLRQINYIKENFIDKLSGVLTQDLLSLEELSHELYSKSELEQIKMLNETYASSLMTAKKEGK